MIPKFRNELLTHIYRKKLPGSAFEFSSSRRNIFISAKNSILHYLNHIDQCIHIRVVLLERHFY